MHSSGDVKNSKFKKILPVIIILIIAGIGVNALMNVSNNQGYSPEQPIPFSHKLHAGQYNIPCMYCHVGVEKSRHASVPPMNVCMNCHSVVKPESPHIQKLKKMFAEKKEIEWVKVHDLPDFVVFNHKRHIAKGVTCETCHGEVKQMARIKQEKPLTMGWCLDCHKGKTTPEYIADAAAKARAEGKSTSTDPKQSVSDSRAVAPTSCFTCHR